MQTAEQTLDVGFMEFDLKYRKDEGDPRRIFRSMVELIDSVELTGKVFLKGIDSNLTFHLGVHETRKGSLVTKVFGMVKRKNGERLPKEQEAVLTKGIAEANKAILRAQGKVDKKGHINEKEVAEKIAALQKESAQTYSRATGRSVPLLVSKPASEKQMRSVMSSLATGVFMLEAGDQVGIVIDAEPFALNPDLRPYDAELVPLEMGLESMTMTEVGAGPKLVRVLTPRYGTPKGWEIIHEGQAYKTEILHAEWFDRIHEQLDEVGPKDQLLVEAEFEIKKTRGGRTSAICKINRIVSVKKYHPEVGEKLEGMGDLE